MRITNSCFRSLASCSGRMKYMKAGAPHTQHKAKWKHFPPHSLIAKMENHFIYFSKGKVKYLNILEMRLQLETLFFWNINSPRLHFKRRSEISWQCNSSADQRTASEPTRAEIGRNEMLIGFGLMKKKKQEKLWDWNYLHINLSAFHLITIIRV